MSPNQETWGTRIARGTSIAAYTLASYLNANIQISVASARLTDLQRTRRPPDGLFVDSRESAKISGRILC